MSNLLTKYPPVTIRRFALLLLTCILLGACELNPCTACALTQLTRYKHLVAEYYAPIVFQDTDADGYRYDYITKVNFDGEYNTSNNWDNATSSELPAYVYYSVSETPTHYFIGYFFYHPRDWGREHYLPVGDEHDNDLEGIMLMVTKSHGDAITGQLIAMETEAHNDLYQFAYCPDKNSDGDIDAPNDDAENDATLMNAPGGEDVDGCMMVYTTKMEVRGNAEAGDTCVNCSLFDLPDNQYKTGVHPAVFVQSMGHGVGGCGYQISGNPVTVDCVDAPGDDGIVYYYGDEAQVPSGGSGNYTRKVSYRLIPMDAGDPNDPSQDQGLWYLQNPGGFSGPTDTYWRWGIFNGEEHDAKAPWAWDDSDDNQVYVGDIFCDPAFAFDTHLDGSEFTSSNYSLSYSDHVYYTHRLVLDKLKISDIKDQDGDKCDYWPRPKECDVYLGVEASFDSGSPLEGLFIENDNWEKDNMKPGEWFAWFHGGYDATGPSNYAQHADSRYICRPPGSSFTIRPWDADDAASDDAIDGPYTISSSAIPIVSMDSNGTESPGTELGHVTIKFALYRNSEYLRPSPEWWLLEPEVCHSCTPTP